MKLDNEILPITCDVFSIDKIDLANAVCLAITHCLLLFMFNNLIMWQRCDKDSKLKRYYKYYIQRIKHYWQLTSFIDELFWLIKEWSRLNAS